MAAEYSFEELQRRVWDAVHHDHKEDPKIVEADIRRSIRAAKPDPDLVVRLRLLLGELLYWTKEHAKAREQYRRALRLEPDSVEAMIHTGWSFDGADRLRRGKQWYEAAYQTAEVKQDHAGEFAALDHLAGNAHDRGDREGMSGALDMMCHVLAHAPRIEDTGGPFIFDWLILEREATAALPLAECLIKHVLARGYPRRCWYTPFSAFAEILAQDGHSDDDIRLRLEAFRPAAADEEVAEDFDIAVAWAFGLGRFRYRDMQSYWRK